MDQASVVFWYDYVDPASYVLDRLLRDLAPGAGVRVEHSPFEIRRPPAPIVDASDPGWRDYQNRMEAAAREAGLSMATPRLVPWSRKAHELALFAREAGAFGPVHDALFHAYFVEGRDIGRVDVLVELGSGAGLDAGTLKAALDVDRHVEALETERARAGDLGVRGVPTLLSDGSKLEGFHPSGRIRTFLQRAASGTQR